MTVLTEPQVEQYQLEGYIIKPAFFQPREVAAMQAELERLVREDLGRNTMPASTGRVNYQIRQLDQKSTLIRALFFHERVLGAVAQLIGQPILLWLDQIYLKPARVGMGNIWHTDNSCFQAPDVTRGVGMWIALHDASRANGTLEVIPRSHLIPEVAARQGVMLDFQLMLSLLDESQAVPAEMPAGSAIFFNFGMLHCTRDNLSDGERAGLALHFLQADNLPPAAAMHQGRNIPLTGPAATGGRHEYGEQVAGTWPDEVRRCAPPAPTSF